MRTFSYIADAFTALVGLLMVVGAAPPDPYMAGGLIMLLSAGSVVQQWTMAQIEAVAELRERQIDALRSMGDAKDERLAIAHRALGWDEEER